MFFSSVTEYTAIIRGNDNHFYIYPYVSPVLSGVRGESIHWLELDYHPPHTGHKIQSCSAHRFSQEGNSCKRRTCRVCGTLRYIEANQWTQQS